MALIVNQKSPIVNLIDVTFTYPNGPTIMQHFSLSIAKGEAWALLGPSGCGKSTLLYLLAGLYQPTAGQVMVDGQPITRPRPKTGLILQDYGLLPWATVWDNVALGIDIRRFYGPDGKHAPVDEPLPNKRTQVDYWLRQLGIDQVAQQYPNHISGGQRQRAAIARTLILKPDLLLMDEPFGALDALTREDLQHLTLKLCCEQQLTMLIVTHNIDEAAFMGHKILLMTQPPTTKPLVVDNPQAGTPGYRQSPEFFHHCNHLRQLLGRNQ